MAIKDLFRKRSKSRVRSNSRSDEISRATTPTPSGTLANAGATSSSSNQRQSINNRRGSVGSAAVLDQTSTPYQNQPAGRPPSRGAVPLGGNATSERDRSRTRSIGAGRSMESNRASQGPLSSTTTGTTTAMGNGGVTTTTTTTTTTGSKPTSKVGHKHGLSRSQDIGHTYTSSDVPPQIPDLGLSGTSGQGSLPIANEFSASSWYNQSRPALAPQNTTDPVFTQQRDTTSSSAHLNDNLASIPKSVTEPVDSVAATSVGAGSAQAKPDGHRRKMSIPRKQVSNSALRQQALPIRDEPAARALDTTTQTATKQSAPLAANDYTVPKVGEIRQGQQQIYNRPYLVEGATQAPSLEGVVNLTNTVDTTTHIRYAPAVLHETVLPQVHHIREEQYTREYHNYHIHHRTQPVIDVQVLPPKHLIRSGDGPNATWTELPASSLPGRPESHFVIAETVSKIAGEHAPHARGRDFTARTFGPEEGEHREYTSEAGVPTTETTWIHPPRLAQAGRLAGETVPFPMTEEAELAGEGPGYVDGSGHVVVGGGPAGASQAM